MQTYDNDPRPDETDESAPPQTDERDETVRQLNDALMRWLAEFDALEPAA